MKGAVIGLGAAVIIAGSGYAMRDQFAGLMGESGAPIEARVTLKNNCDVSDQAFILRDTKTDHYATFRGGVARLRTVEHNRLRVEIAPRYKDVDMTSHSAPAAKTMTMTAKCSGSGWNTDIFTRD